MSEFDDYITLKQLKVHKTPSQRGYSTAAAAEYLGVSKNTLYEIAAAGHLHPKDLRGRRVFMKEELDGYLDSLKPWRGEPKDWNAGKP